MSSNSEVAIIEGLTTSGFAILVLFGLYIFINYIGRDPQCNNIFSSFRSSLFALLNFLPILLFFGGSFLFLYTMGLIKNLKVSLPGIYLFNNILSGIVLLISAFNVYKYSNFVCNNYKPNLFKSLTRILIPVIIVIILMPFELIFIKNYQTDG